MDTVLQECIKTNSNPLSISNLVCEDLLKYQNCSSLENIKNKNEQIIEYGKMHAGGLNESKSNPVKVITNSSSSSFESDKQEHIEKENEESSLTNRKTPRRAATVGITYNTSSRPRKAKSLPLKAENKTENIPSISRKKLKITLKLKSHESKEKDAEEFPFCPVCQSTLLDDDYLAAAHVESCLNRAKRSDFKITPIQQLFTDSLELEKEDDSDFGPPQFTNKDILEQPVGSCKIQHTKHNLSPFSANHTLEQALNLINELKAELSQIPRCSLCMENYTDPLTCTLCWHVHCKECWMNVLKSKRLCPKCKIIVTPESLRSIYL